MPKSKTWTETDLTAARAWVERKATTPIFRDTNTVSLEQVRTASDADLPGVLREVLTAEGWKALLNALHQRAHQARRRPVEPRDGWRSADRLHQLGSDPKRLMEDAGTLLTLVLANHVGARGLDAEEDSEEVTLAYLQAAQAAREQLVDELGLAGAVLAGFAEVTEDGMIRARA
jgi:hypothetical protein